MTVLAASFMGMLTPIDALAPADRLLALIENLRPHQKAVYTAFILSTSSRDEFRCKARLAMKYFNGLEATTQGECPG